MLKSLTTNKLQNEISDYSLKLDHLCYISTSGFVIEDRLSNIYECSEYLTQFSRGFSLGSISVESGDFDLSSFTLSFIFSKENSNTFVPVLFDCDVWIEIDSEKIYIKSSSSTFFSESIEDLGDYFFFCITRSGTSITCYINGEKKKSFGITLPNKFGITFVATSGGYIDRIYLYCYQFTDQQVVRLYSSFIFPSYWNDGFGYVSTHQDILGKT